MRVSLARMARKIYYLAAAVIILSALIVTVGRLFTPYLNDHLPDIDILASRWLKAPVNIGKVYISWDLYEPELSFDDIKFQDQITHKTKFELQNAVINFSIFRSVMSRELVVESIKVSGVNLDVHQDQQGQVNVSGLGQFQVSDNFNHSSVSSNDVFNWVFSIPHLVLKYINVRYYPHEGPPLSFSLRRFVLNNEKESHSLVGQGILNQEIPTQLEIHVDWNGNITDLQHITAHTYVYMEGVNLAQWLDQKQWQNLQITQGLGSAKVWATWEHNAWQEIQTSLQFYDIEVQSLTTKNSLTIPRIAGHAGWRRDGNKQIFAGDEVYLDLPKHLWPVTNFSLTLVPEPSTGNLSLAAMQLSYFDLNDVKELALSSGLLSADQQQKLTALNPQGEIQDFQLQTIPGKEPVFGGAFKGLSFNAWKNFPGIKNATGVLSWNGHQGTLDLNSKMIDLTLDSIFANHLVFEQLSGKASIQQDDKGAWLFQGKDILAINADVSAHANMTLVIPAEDSPQINLAGDFKVANVAHISRYLPLKTFSPPLVNWLQQAFLAGQVTSGEAELQGRLADFPFDKGNGKFVISTLVNNINFRFAPEWPMLSHLKGKLIFNGRRMNIDTDAGSILNIPIQSVHAVIPYIGEGQPQIVNVQSDLHVDCADALRFIHMSPLEKTLGHNLGNMQLTGPMDLNLNLSIPLSKPEETKIQGNATIPNAVMQLPQWKLAFENLQGAIHFTESDIIAKDLRGKLLGEDAVLNIATQHPANQESFVQANLQSVMDLAQLQKMLGVSISDMATGSTPFTVELNLYSGNQKTQQTNMNIHTDLQGIALNFPAPYGKNADEKRDLQINITTPDQQIRTKIKYDNLLTAALTFQQSEEELRFVGGEVNLGGEANWQTQPGLLIQGEFKQLDWDSLQKQFATKTNTNIPLLRKIDLHVGTFNIFGQQLTQANIQLNKMNRAWIINIESPQVAGVLNVGDNLKQITGKFQRFYLKANNSKAYVIDPKTLPAISFTGDDVRYGEKNIGSVILNLVPAASALTIRELHIESPLVDLQAQGEWSSSAAGKYTTHLTGTITSAHVSDLLSAWGYQSNNFISKQGNINFNLTWPDAPYNFVASGMSGSFALSLGPGSIVNLSESNTAKMDFARLMNVFSLTSLPKLGQIFQKGYAFDFAKGDFSLKNGNAFTANTRISGALALIAISGRIGFANKDFDIVLSVTPYVTESLPFVAAAVTAWNPITGIAAWMINKVVVSRAISKAATHTYTIKGPWSDPVWNQVSTSR